MTESTNRKPTSGVEAATEDRAPTGRQSGAPGSTDTPETDNLLLVINEGRVYHTDEPVAELARRLERERDEARRIAEAYRHVWDLCSAAVDTAPNPDPLPWSNAKVSHDDE